MKLLEIALLLSSSTLAVATPLIEKRDAQFLQGQPIDANGKGGPILGLLFDHRDILLSATNRMV
jgi:oxalate decarboxylase